MDCTVVGAIAKYRLLKGSPRGGLSTYGPNDVDVLACLSCPGDLKYRVIGSL